MFFNRKSLIDEINYRLVDDPKNKIVLSYLFYFEIEKKKKK